MRLDVSTSALELVRPLTLPAGRARPADRTSSVAARVAPGPAARALAGLGRARGWSTALARRGIDAALGAPGRGGRAGAVAAATSCCRTGTASGKSLAYLLPGADARS